ncbi:winged helix-turn-helix domain-containing protein [Frankia sp. AgB32]|uniref:winged helix-turn-helix domain-containing protein n=1 Tax=Frankia sp. AgB32 TaxID=631119 RepID=UPI00200E0D22|nr:winged helix-turn-helix domain-containing protein [Frankia sp. AgB32]MCK9894771.1 winged helix-turn-helix domain-containing protein [Frankia sp. AgB32]
MATINPDPLRRVGRALDGALWLVALLVGAYSLANVHSVAVGHHTDDPQAWLLAPIVDLALFTGITADSVLARHGLHPTRWGTGLRWFCGLATWTLNVWDAAASLDAGAIVAHSVPPVVLILLAEAAPRYRHQFATLTTTPPADLPAPAPTPATEAASPPPASTPTTDPTPPTKDVPAPRTGTSPRRRTGTPSKRRTARRTDADLIAALADVPRDPDGTVPVRRAAAALGCGPDRARRLLTAQGLLRPRTTDAPTAPTPVLTAV